MSYTDFFLIPLPKGNEAEYKKQIETFVVVMKDFGLEYYCESIADDVPRGEATDFYRAVSAKETETLVAGFARWPDKATRDKAWSEGMNDPRLAEVDSHKRIFDGKRMIYGAFQPIYEYSA